MLTNTLFCDIWHVNSIFFGSHLQNEF